MITEESVGALTYGDLTEANLLSCTVLKNGK